MGDWVAIIAGLVGVALGAGLAWLLTRPLLKAAEANGEQRGAARAAVRVAELETQLAGERQAAADKLRLLDEAEQKLSNAFKALAADALRGNNETFTQQAQSTFEKLMESARGDLSARQTSIDELIKPLRESLEKVDVNVRELEKTRAESYGGLTAQLRSMAATEDQLRSETGNLVRALRSPTVRGRWGEMQLKRVVELADMIERCDFVQQESASTPDGKLRPDMIVKLPGGKQVVVDSKVPLAAYMEALEAPDDDARSAKLREHARQVRTHLTQLSDKAYWDEFRPAPEFVVLFLPGESFFSAALQHDPSLIEAGVGRKVILATPTTLIALLRAVAYGWREERIAESAEEISALGRDLHKRLATLASHLDGVGNGLGTAVKAYNKAVGSFESRVLVAARRFSDLGAGSGEELASPARVDSTPRTVSADLLGAPAEPLSNEVERGPAGVTRPLEGLHD
ncbi:MAG: hypothetical protein CHACPFDD_03203 [Phycisphaerae bacterium]|nr:hypothetical protein [Phycisphaerae bacterium]